MKTIVETSLKTMPHTPDTITVTELARNLATVIDRVRVSSRRIAITRGTQTVAELSPVVQPGMTLGKLVDILKHQALTEHDLREYQSDLKAVRESATLPPSPWE